MAAVSSCPARILHKGLFAHPPEKCNNVNEVAALLFSNNPQCRFRPSYQLSQLNWLKPQILPFDHNPHHLVVSAIDSCQRNRVEPPTVGRLERIIRSAANAYDNELFEQIYHNLSEIALNQIDRFFKVDTKNTDDQNSKIKQESINISIFPGYYLSIRFQNYLVIPRHQFCCL